jgi:hypothetical protein
MRVTMKTQRNQQQRKSRRDGGSDCPPPHREASAIVICGTDTRNPKGFCFARMHGYSACYLRFSSAI